MGEAKSADLQAALVDLLDEPLDGLLDSPSAEFHDVPYMEQALQYAYDNALITDYTLNSFSIAHVLGRSVQSTMLLTNDNDLADDSHLTALELPVPSPFDKTLRVTNAALNLIAEARHVLSDAEAQQLTTEVCEASTRDDLRLELPLLRTSNHCDMRQYHKENVCRHSDLLDSIVNHALPLDSPDTSKGEGMTVPPDAITKVEALMKKLEQEKIGVTRENLTYLASMTRSVLSDEDRLSYLIEQIECEKPEGPRKLTPPASPKLNQDQLLPVFDPAAIPLPTDSAFDLVDNFLEIEEIMLGRYQDSWAECNSPAQRLLDNVLTIPDREIILVSSPEQGEDLKVEVPLMLDNPPSELGLFGLDEFADFINAELDLNSGMDGGTPQSLSFDNLERQLAKAAEPAILSLEQEQLQAIDAVGRVPVPVVDFSCHEPEWMRLHNDAKAIFRWVRSLHDHLYKPPSWPIHKASESKLVWRPYVTQPHSDLERESIDLDELVIHRYLGQSKDDGVSSSLGDKTERSVPLVLQDDEWDEEITPILSMKNPKNDLTEMVRKRSSDLRTENVTKRRRSAPQNVADCHGVEGSGLSILAGDAMGASARLLENFLQVHAPKNKVWTHSKYFAPLGNARPPAQLPDETTEVAQTNGAVPDHARHSSSRLSKHDVKAPFPDIKTPATALTIFISIKIPRRMLRVLEGLVPNLIFIERNYDAHNISVWRPGSIVRNEIVPPLAGDSDISLSPTTGIILTSMIKIRQKPREGTTKGVVHMQIEKASLRYERLFVLIGGEGGSDDTLREMTSSDCIALQELQGYATGLDSNVQVLYVGGGARTLANWVASFICRYGLAEPEISKRLLEEETLWELFLRRAGLNVFAAQTVASQLKQPDAEKESAFSSYGLGEFVSMTRAERLQRFGQLVGTKVLERISHVVDQQWNSV